MTAEIIAVGGGIYSITNSVNGKLYVGSAVDFKRRWYLHINKLAKDEHENRYLQRAFNKYGAGAFTFSVLEEVPDKTELLTREQHWLDELDVVSKGYNISPTAGSRLGAKVSSESRARMSASAKGKVISVETRAKLSAAGMGRIVTAETRAKKSAARLGMKMPQISAALKGRTRSPETVEKHRRAITGRKQSPEAIARQVAAMIGRVVPQETRDKISAANKGKSIPAERRARISATLTGKKQSPETIEKRKIAIAKIHALKKSLREASS